LESRSEPLENNLSLDKVKCLRTSDFLLDDSSDSEDWTLDCDFGEKTPDILLWDISVTSRSKKLLSAAAGSIAGNVNDC